MDTLAVRLTVPLAGPVEDLHLQVVPGGHHSGPGQRQSRRFAPCLAHQKKADPERSARLGAYYRRWRGWVCAGLAISVLNEDHRVVYPSLAVLLDRRTPATANNPRTVSIRA